MDTITRTIVDTGLTPRQRDVYLLYYDGGLSQTEIAMALDLNKTTVCRTLRRAEQRVDRIMRYVRMKKKGR